jgi:hypothetical protein
MQLFKGREDIKQVKLGTERVHAIVAKAFVLEQERRTFR